MQTGPITVAELLQQHDESTDAESMMEASIALREGVFNIAAITELADLLEESARRTQAAHDLGQHPDLPYNLIVRVAEAVTSNFELIAPAGRNHQP